MKKIILLLLSVSFFATLEAQQSLRGIVIAADNKKPVALANVFLSNTSVGTVTNDKGEFTIDRFPSGRYDVVISCIGYESYVTTLQSNQLPEQLHVTLKPKVHELQEVVVAPFEKNGWERWGKFFVDNFVGTSAFAEDCKLKNKDVIKFRYDKKANVLQAFASEPVILENKALGYILKYDLKDFIYNYNTRILYFQGYPLFEEMETSRNRLKERWERNREDSYYGSLMHFMRSVFRNRLVENGFEARKLIKISEEEKKRVKDLYRNRMLEMQQGGLRIVMSDSALAKGNKDSAAYYRKVMSQPDKLAVLINQVLPGDSIAYAIDSITAGIFFQDHLQVTYKHKLTPPEFITTINPAETYKGPVVSEIFLVNKKELVVLANGSYFEGIDMISSGYWGWWEKLATMLPFDYWPKRNKLPLSKQ
ncbi:carboxypeptidase-like regulatory domain-containing protein [Sediminibacterium ginsengisoli]|uniref:CarboxypepD_reg-like domain-containing protein n=1 Tax=Sediminibacterium ginsengisoli TaxID=413434 RepID=A0A1T4QJH8_9BACT|nr:carboxypeptidase-like regulatory domain-containing protein [Sediminibacterium ginsengisoli]SKA03428.1 CarboxypepD_reg-like domain-containing protein [Sediminibacterium ginsengisoli]